MSAIMDAICATSEAEAARMAARASRRFFFGILALPFAAAAAATIADALSMSRMRGMPMPGGWTMSMMWMPMPGRTWLEAAAAFVGMWTLMMIAMMTPVLAPVLWRYRRVLPSGEGRGTRLVWAVASGYFLACAAVGAVAFPAGASIADAAMRQPLLARAVPLAAGAIVLIAGWFQLGAWKRRQLICSRAEPRNNLVSTRSVDAIRHGWRLGLRCNACCASYTAVLLVVGVMDLRAMAIATLAITLERLAPVGERIACAVGAGMIVSGLAMMARAVAEFA